MRCRKIEKILLMGKEADEKAQAAAAGHIAECNACALFRAGLLKLREQISGPAPELPVDLMVRTRHISHARLRTAQNRSFLHRTVFDVPLPVAALLIIATGLTLLWIIPGLTEISIDEPLTGRSTLSVAIIIQNMLMLILSPVLLKNRNTLKRIKTT